MTKPRRFALFQKYMAVLVPIFLALAVPGLAAIVSYEMRGHEETLAARIGNQAARTAAAFVRHGAFDKPDLARDLMAPLVADPAFLCAEIRHRDIANPVATAPFKIGCRGVKASNRIEIPVGESGMHTLSIQFSDAEIVAAEQLERTLTLLVVIFAFLFATIAAAIGFRQIITRPLDKLLTAIRQYAETGERIPIDIASNDELGVVAGAYNNLLQQELEREEALKQTNRALERSKDEYRRLNAELEERVRSRTADLRIREAALSDSEQRFKDFAQASSDWYWEMDSNLRFSYFSDRFKEVTGVEPSMLLGKTREETGVPNVDPAQWQRHLHALHNKLPFRNFIHPRQKADGSTVWLSINGVPYFNRCGDFMGFRGTGNEITDLVEAEKKAEEARLEAETANRAKSDFLANMSHELRTPLNAIIGYTELLKEEAQDRQDAPLLDDLSKVGQAGKQLLELVTNILDISKIEADMMDVSLDHTEIEILIADVADVARPLAAQKGNRLHINNEADSRTVLTDTQKLRQTLLNLLSNAAKFTEDGDIYLTVREDTADTLTFEIRDTGIGMTADTINAVFEPFVQGDTSTSKKYGGTGLGLALCLQFVELLHGRLGVESEVGAGSRFTVTIPIHENAAHGSPAAVA